VGTLI